MLGLRKALGKLKEDNKQIKVCLVGAGLMGKGLVSQIMRVDGMLPSIVVSNKIQDCIASFELAGINRDDIYVGSDLKGINIAMEKGKFVACDNWEIGIRANLIDVVVDATGVPDTGARIATATIENKKHVVMLNV